MNGLDPTPDTSVTESGPNSRSDTPPIDEQLGATGRPVRAAVVTAAAISEAQNDILAKFDSTMDSVQKTKRGTGTGRGRGGYKKLNDGVKLPRASKVGPGGGGRKSNKA